MNQVYYKVVRGKLTSATVDAPLAKTYRVGRFIKVNPNLLKLGLGLTCFSNLESAKSFVQKLAVVCPLTSMYALSIYRCEIGRLLPTTVRPVFYMFFRSDGTREYKIVTRSVLKGLRQALRSECNRHSWPPGTIMTDRIKLIKKENSK
jgi:hypothetical protein